MKKAFLPVLVLSLFIVGCTSSVKNDFLNYINNEINSISSLEDHALDTYENITSKENFSYEELYLSLKNQIIPNYTKFVERLEKIEPSTREIKDIHSYYIKGARKQLEALITLKEGLEERNQEKLNLVNSLLTESKGYMDIFKKEIISLAEKYRINYELE